MFWHCLQVPDKNGRIKGTAAASIALGPNIFTDIAYEGGMAAGQLAGQHVWVASAAGAVFQVNYARCAAVWAHECCKHWPKGRLHAWQPM